MEIFRSHVLVCSGTGCVSSGCGEVWDKFKQQLSEKELENEVKMIQTGCHGLCELGPIVIVYPEGTSYFQVTGEDVPELVEEHLLKGRPVERLMYMEPVSEEKVPYYNEINFYKKQQRIVLRNCGYLNPEDIHEYIARRGYEGLSRALVEMTPEQTIQEVKDAGLRGRGGAGFPAGVKWNFAYQESSDKKYVICNADEGDPGAFMDRSILEGDPHSVIEGMIIAGYAIGADEGYVYVRAEYPLAVQRLKKAIEDAEGLGLLGEDILGTGFNFKLNVKEGAGAFVCGEETALMASIEGNRGMPRPRPPFPAQKGLWGKPTNINNVETLACVPVILAEGAQKFGSVGTEGSKGTKVFALTGKINNTGLVEVPMGIKIKDIVYTIGGGIQEDKDFKAVQIGGPSGGCLPEDKIDLPIDFDSLTEAGAMMGSGGLVVMDEVTCIVDVARYFLNFTQTESCGKCTPCREGTKRMLETLERITDGEGKEGDVELLQELAHMVKDTSLCGLGQTAPNPVITTIKYFRDEYDAHIFDKTCPAGNCRALLSYKILEDLCNGCGRCAKACPQDAISGEKKELHVIDQDKCTKCGACVEKCKFEAIVLA